MQGFYHYRFPIIRVLSGFYDTLDLMYLYSGSSVPSTKMLEESSTLETETQPHKDFAQGPQN